MTIDVTHFTPWSSLGGGLLLGLAAAMFIWLNGRILGISGIVGGLLAPRKGDMVWRLAMLAGMAASPWVFQLIVPQAYPSMPRIDASMATTVVAGLLVGVGTRFGAGCTSGHGVCGLSRLSPRSLVATLSFMGAGFAVVYIVRHGLSGASA